jgi:hypothetical protein
MLCVGVKRGLFELWTEITSVLKHSDQIYNTKRYDVSQQFGILSLQNEDT